MPQDLPPSGGYEPVQYKVSPKRQVHMSIAPCADTTLQQRNLPIRGFRPVYYLAVMGAIMTYGMYKVGQGNRELT